MMLTPLRRPLNTSSSDSVGRRPTVGHAPPFPPTVRNEFVPVISREAMVGYALLLAEEPAGLPNVQPMPDASADPLPENYVRIPPETQLRRRLESVVDRDRLWDIVDAVRNLAGSAVPVQTLLQRLDRVHPVTEQPAPVPVAWFVACIDDASVRRVYASKKPQDNVDKRTVDSLVDMLANGNEEEIRSAGAALKRIAPAHAEQVLTYVVNLLLRGSDFRLLDRMGIVAAYGPLAAPMLAKALAALCETNTGHRQHYTLMAAVARQLALLGRLAEAAIPELLQALESCRARREKSTSAARGEALHQLTRALRSAGGDRVVVFANAVELVMLGLNGQNGAYRITSIDLLGEMGPAAHVAVPHLVRRIFGTDDQEALAAGDALEHMGAGAVSAIVPMLIASDWREPPLLLTLPPCPPRRVDVLRIADLLKRQRLQPTALRILDGAPIDWVAEVQEVIAPYAMAGSLNAIYALGRLGAKGRPSAAALLQGARDSKDEQAAFATAKALTHILATQPMDAATLDLRLSVSLFLIRRSQIVDADGFNAGVDRSIANPSELLAWAIANGWVQGLAWLPGDGSADKQYKVFLETAVQLGLKADWWGALRVAKQLRDVATFSVDAERFLPHMSGLMAQTPSTVHQVLDWLEQLRGASLEGVESLVQLAQLGNRLRPNWSIGTLLRLPNLAQVTREMITLRGLQRNPMAMSHRFVLQYIDLRKHVPDTCLGMFQRGLAARLDLTQRNAGDPPYDPYDDLQWAELSEEAIVQGLILAGGVSDVN